MNCNTEIRRMRWLVAMLMLVAAMVVPTMAWAQDDSAGSYDSNGFAIDGSYQPAELTETTIDGQTVKVYGISNAGQLYWFAGLVNGDASVCDYNADTNSGGTQQNTAANAVLTDNITVNTGVLDSNGNIASDVRGFRSWTPIGSNYNNRYTGTFDGNGNTISGLYFNDSSKSNVGLFGYISDGTIKNVGIVDSYFNGREYIGGLCGENQGPISDCYFFGSVNGETYVAGLCGEMYNGSLSSCYFVGTVSGNNFVGAVCGFNDRAPITNCFFNSDIYTGVAVGKNDCGTITNVLGKTTAQFKSGEVAYQLNGDRDVWGQTINTNDYPIFGGIKVYATTGCVSYSNDPNYTGTVAHDFTHSTDGKCSNCGNYEEPVKDENGVYQIDTFSKLYWFANQVNSGTRDIDAVLTADITVNTSVLKDDGTLAADTNGFIAWTPIGNSTSPYIGNFDGQQHTISGLYYNDNTADNVGLFGYIGGVMNNGYIPCGSIKNVSIADSYFCGKDYVGGICGKSETNPINNCSNSGTVNGQNFVGGVCGINKYGLVIECSNIGMVNGNDQVGGVCGGNYYDSGTINNWNIESGVIRNCSNTGKVSGHSIVGGVCGNNAATLDGCSNSGAINGISNNIGGVCGQSSKSGSIGGEINNSHNTGTVTGKGNAIGGVCGNGINNVIRYCDNKGNVTGAYSFVGGICGFGSSVAIYSSYNTGAVSGIDYVGGIGGSGSISGYNSYNTGAISGNNYVGGLGGNSGYFYNCFSIGTVSGESNVGGINGGNSDQIINCYYDSNKFTGPASCGHSKYYINVCGKTTAQFKSGEVAYLLDALSDTYNSNDTGIDWGQTIGVEDFPVLGGQRVYATKGCATYSNVESATENEHSFGNGDVCTVCGSYRPATPDANGVYQIGSVNDLYWFAQQVNSGNTEISAVLTADITINEGVLKADGPLADDPSGLKQWQPIAYYGRKAASGTFDGNGHTISGLYVNDPSRSCVGLFANLSENATVKNLIIKDSYILGAVNVGGVCGFSYGSIANCGFIGAVSGNDHVGGVCGCNHEAQISNSYFNGTVSGNDNVGGVYGLYDKASPITNCYYLASEDDKQGGKTTAQFKSGEVAWLLNGSTSEGTDDAPLAWYQNIDGDGTADEYPIPSSSHGTVYQCTKCTGTYSNTANKTAEHQYGEDNGICTKCGDEHQITITLPESLQHGAIKVYDEAKTDLTPAEGNTITVNGHPSLTFTAVADETEVAKYKVKSFKYGDTDVPSDGIIKVKEDITLTAEFELDCFVVDGVKYQIMDGVSEVNTVRVIGVTPDDKGAAIIPVSVSYNEDGEESEYEPVTYTIKEIGKDAFADMQGMTKLYVNSISPLSIEAGSTPFAGIAQSVALRVPYGAIDAYKAENCPWKEFTNILSFTLVDGNIVDCVKINVTTNDANLGGFEIYLPNAGELVPVVNNSEVPFGATLSLTVTPKVDEEKGKAYATLSVKNGDTALTKEEGEVYALTVGNEDLNIDIAFALKSFQDDNLKYEMVELGGDKVKVTGKVGTATTLTIPASVTSPDNNELSYAVTQIADNAFENNSEITSVKIPASIVSIGAKAFGGCSKLEDIIFTGTVPPTTIGEGAFSGISTDAIIMVPIASVDKYKEALGDALASKVIGDKGVITLTHNQGGKINVYVVNGDTETLQTPADGKVLVDWGTQVKIEAVADEGYIFEWLKINDESLGNDKNTYTVRIMRYSPSTVSGQGENFGDITAEASFSVKIATSGGGGNESVTIKGSIDTTGGTQTIIVTHCDEGTESATIPEALGASGTTYIPVTSIAANAFEGCSSLKTVEIPSSITKIGSDAFKGCTSLESFKIKKTTTAMPSTSATRAAARAAADVVVPRVDANAFDDIVDKATLYVPEGWKEAFKDDAVWSRFTKIKEYRDDENETVLAELTLTASAGGSLTVGAVTSENNTQTVKVAEDSEVTVTITPADGYILGSLLYSGQDVTAQVVGGTLTLTALEGENSLAAVFSIDTGIGAVYDMVKTVYVRDGRIIIDGAAAGEVVIVCDAAGRVLRREVANGEPIELPMAAGKVYIVRIGKQVIKLTM